MNAQTFDELSGFLRADLSWRRKENAILRTIVRNAEASKQQPILRGAIAVLYAHWEGFVKSACRTYLDYVKLRKLRNDELCVPLLGLALKLRLKSSPQMENLDSHSGFCDWLLSEWNRRAKLPKSEDVVSTSNLNAAVFKSYMLGLGLPYVHDFAQAEKPVIEPLVKLRNHLAHGEWKIVDPDEYEQFYVWTERLMNQVCDSIEDAAIGHKYRRALVTLS